MRNRFNADKTKWRRFLLPTVIGTIVALATSCPVFAKTDFWMDESSAFNGVTNNSCSGSCHSIQTDDAVRIPDQKIPSKANSLVVEPPTKGLHFSWRYRKANTAGIGNFLDNVGVKIVMPLSTKNAAFEYCVGVTDDTNVRKIWCDTFIVKRADSNPFATQPDLPFHPGINPVFDPGFGIALPDSNQPPQAFSDRFVFSASGSQLLDVLDNDRDPEKLPLSIELMSVESQQGVALFVEKNKVRYRRTDKLLKTDSFTYKAKDKKGALSAIATVSIVASDKDGDSVVDVLDNCELIPNPDQLDMDEDGLGFLCDPDDDGDGAIGVSGQELNSGKELVEKECLSCHQNLNTGAPQYGVEEDWATRLEAAGSIDELVLSAINGKPELGMPMFGDRYSPQQLIEAVLYLSGLESSVSGVSSTPPEGDADGDSVVDGIDNCPGLPNTNQQDIDANGTGDICEPSADNDGDGYIFALDDDDSNANRLPGSSVQLVGGTMFRSERNLSLGRIAQTAAGSSAASILLDDQIFMNAAAIVHAAIEPTLDDSISRNFQIMDISMKDAQPGTAPLIIRLLGNLPFQPVLKVYKPQTAAWEEFRIDESNRIASAPTSSGDCPLADSSNYSDGLQVGLGCIRIYVSDGGLNDSDVTQDGSTSLTARIGTPVGAEPTSSSPDEVDGNPSKGGGSISWLWLGLFILTMLSRYSDQLTLPRKWCK